MSSNSRDRPESPLESRASRAFLWHMEVTLVPPTSSGPTAVAELEEWYLWVAGRAWPPQEDKEDVLPG